MHRSRIGVVLVDHPTPTYASASAFWGAVVGRSPEPLDGQPYASLGDLNGVQLAMQETGAGTPVRVHLDVETDDVDAEVARLSALGATVTDRREEYAIMADPGGLVFCVVPVQTGDEFERAALSWD
jgi:predicted enzyme related to lactoylglutathione lyase